MHILTINVCMIVIELENHYLAMVCFVNIMIDMSYIDPIIQIK